MFQYFRLYNVFSAEVILALAYVILIVGLSFPYGVPVFFPFLAMSFCFLFIKNLGKTCLSIKINTGILLFYFCILMYFLALAFNQGKIFKLNNRDLKNIISLLILSCILGPMVWEKYDRFVVFYHRLIVPVMSFVALVSLYNFYHLISGGNAILLGVEKSQYAIGTSVSGSYNMFALGMYAGIFASASAFSRSRSTFFRTLCCLCVVLCTSAVLLAGSRRGWIVIAFLSFWVLFGLTLSFFRLVLDGGGRVFSYVKNNLGVLVVLFVLCTVGLVFLAGRTLDVEKPLELNKLVYRLSTLGAEQGGFRRAFSKRTDLWADAGELIEAFNFFELFLGSGFEFFQFYGRKSGAGADSEADPHNFIISAMLYSGLIGCVVMVGLISLTLFRLFRKREKYGIDFLLLYVTALVFTITGAPSLFSVRLVPVMILTTFSVHD